MKVFVSNFKVEKRENLDNAFYVFYVFLTWHFKKRKKSRFLNFQKKRKKRILELWVTVHHFDDIDQCNESNLTKMTIRCRLQRLTRYAAVSCITSTRICTFFIAKQP